MPTGVLQAYVDRLEEVEARRRYEAAIAASVPHWESSAAKEYLEDLASAIQKAQTRMAQVVKTGKAAYDDLMGWFAGLGLGRSSGVEGDD
jgi:acetylornithine deacetylase/succinyl-diaminopimelate desuccinylase-like protein